MWFNMDKMATYGRIFGVSSGSPDSEAGVYTGHGMELRMEEELVLDRSQ